MTKEMFNDMIITINEKGLMTDHKKAILQDIAIIIPVNDNGWRGYKIIGKNGYSFRYFYERIEEVA